MYFLKLRSHSPIEPYLSEDPGPEESRLIERNDNTGQMFDGSGNEDNDGMLSKLLTNSMTRTQT